MIISRTPFRVSFFGGGTDYPTWFEENRGAVLATTINKYCYITCRYLPQFFEHKTRIIYSRMEHVHNIDEIDHPAVREVLRYLNIQDGLEIHHDGDLPARTGLGSSSSFTVGLLNSLYALIGRMPSKNKLAEEAIYIEQQMCQENVGCQDQALAAHGGFNFIDFGGSQHLQVNKVIMPVERLQRLNASLMLYFTGFSRTASVIAEHQIKNIPKKGQELKAMYEMANQGLEYLRGDRLEEFGKLLDEAWMIKRTLSDKISTPLIDEIYTAAKSAGAIGGKLLGAGGGGFVLLFVPPEQQPAVREKLKDLLLVPFEFETLGSQIIFTSRTGRERMLEDVDVVILCGGLGKRLRSVDPDTPKVMVTFEERPFLDIVMERMAAQGLERFILCTGYKAQWIEEYYRRNQRPFVVDFSREEDPLGTGGAVKNAQPIISSDPFLVLNGDCYCEVNYAEFVTFHQEKGGVASLVAAHLEDSRDYGSLTIAEDSRILAFEEKQDKGAAAINAGRYCFNQEIFDKMPEKAKFSLEYDVFPSLIEEGLYGYPSDGDFFDIGTPERYQLAMEYFKNGK